MYILYNILGILVFFVFVLPYYGYRLVREKGFSVRFRQSIGLIRREEIDAVVDTECIWIHGASVGEIVATSPLVKEIKKTMPERKVLVSAFTVGGYNMARQIIPEADAILGTGAFQRIMEAVDETLKGNRVVIAGESEVIYDARMPRIMTTPTYTAYVKIAEGCDNNCAFCAIPMVRGHYRSRTIEDICAEVERLAQNGVKEIFGDEALNQLLSSRGLQLSSANSINWGRLCPQIAYYFYSYLSLLQADCLKLGDKVNFVVPTGNFGNILAAWYAKEMGLPIVKNACPADRDSKRSEIKQLLKDAETDYPDVKSKIFGAMQRLPIEGWGVGDAAVVVQR